MELSDFSSLIEVGVTLNMACVAIEYVKSYTSVLCNQVFGLEGHINEKCNSCKASLVDQTTLENLPTHNLDGKNTSFLKSRLISRRNNLIKEIEAKKQELLNLIKNICRLRFMSSVCLWFALWGILGLFLMAFEEEGGENNWIYILWSAMTILGVLFAILSWCEIPSKYFKLSSLRCTLFLFALSVLLSGLLIFLLCIGDCVKVFVQDSWIYFLIVSMILMYSNFVASAIAIWFNAKESKEIIAETVEKLKEECSKINDDANSLLNVDHLSKLVEEDDSHGSQIKNSVSC